MTDFLVKMLIPDYGNTEDGAVRTRYGMLAGVVGIFCNLLLHSRNISSSSRNPALFHCI